MFCHVTSKVEGEKHPDLLREKGGSGFPMLVFLDGAGQVIARQKERTVAGFETTLAAVARWNALKGRRDDPAIQADLLHAEILLGILDYPTARARRDGLTMVSDAQREALDRELVELEVTHAYQTAPRDREESVRHVGERLVAMKEAGRVPTGAGATRYWLGIFRHAIASKDAALAKEALAGVERALQGDEKARPMIERCRAELEALEATRER